MAAKRKGKSPLMVVGGAKPQLRKRPARAWTKAKEQKFISTLAETCNVSEACREAGVGVTSAYRRKAENAAFRASWLTALSIAYQQLELVLLERAFNGVEKLVSARAGEPQAMREYSNQLGLALLKMHRDSATDADMEFQPDQIEELKSRLLNKLQRLKKRNEADAGAARE